MSRRAGTLQTAGARASAQCPPRSAVTRVQGAATQYRHGRAERRARLHSASRLVVVRDAAAPHAHTGQAAGPAAVRQAGSVIPGPLAHSAACVRAAAGARLARRAPGTASLRIGGRAGGGGTYQGPAPPPPARESVARCAATAALRAVPAAGRGDRASRSGPARAPGQRAPHAHHPPPRPTRCVPLQRRTLLGESASGPPCKLFFFKRPIMAGKPPDPFAVGGTRRTAGAADPREQYKFRAILRTESNVSANCRVPPWTPALPLAGCEDRGGSFNAPVPEPRGSLRGGLALLYQYLRNFDDDWSPAGACCRRCVSCTRLACKCFSHSRR